MLAVGRGGTLGNEARAATELAALVASPVFYGSGVPRGDGKAVLVLPGLFGNDAYLVPIHSWLLRIGYRPIISTIGFNAGCADRVRQRVLLNVASHVAPRAALAVVGHSRGGMLGWSVAARLGERVTHLALLGSPAGAVVRAVRAGRDARQDFPAAATVVEAGERARRAMTPECRFPVCNCDYMQDLATPLSRATRLLSVASNEDPIVPREATITPGAEHVTVSGSHSGLAHNVQVLRAVGAFLAEGRMG
jgi:pimeloyl-ACP methyl ester carboxylesterase